MTIQLYANNAKTTLAAGINASQTSITVAPGTGALFPSPTIGQAFKITLVSAVSATTYEICLCTARSGDTLTVIRGQEGTAGQPFSLNDVVGNYDTAGVMNGLVQSVQLQANYYGYAVATGTANALAASFPSLLSTVTDGMNFVVKSAYANTGPATIAITLGTTVVGTYDIVRADNIALQAGDIPGAGYPLNMIYSSTYNAFVIQDTIVNLTPYALINSQAFTGTPTVPTPPTADSSLRIANTQYVQNNLTAYAPLTGTGTSGTWPINISGVTTNTSSNGYGVRTVSTSAPSGGSNGDVWYQV